MKTFEPVNGLEKALLAAKAGQIPMKVFAGTLLGSDLVLPSAGEVQKDLSGFRPLIFEQSGKPLLAAFTDSSRMLPYRAEAEFFVEMNALQALRRMPKEYGILINANTAGALEISAEGIASMLAEFAPEQ